MMGYEAKENQGKLFYYWINIGERIRADHPPRKIAGLIDFDFIYEKVKESYGIKGNVFVPPPAQGSFRGNIAYIGLALVANLYGNQGLSKAGVLAGFMIPFMNFFSIMGLVFHSSQIQGLLSWKTLIRSVLLNALILGSFLGLLFSFYAWTLPPLLANTFKMVSGLSLPLALLSMGGSLSVRGIQGGLVPTLWASFLKLLGLPLVGLALMQIWNINGLDYKITILLLSCPTAVVTYIMSSELGGDQDLSASIVMLTTLVSVVTISLWVWFVGF